jgi:hypothetical protein
MLHWETACTLSHKTIIFTCPCSRLSKIIGTMVRIINDDEGFCLAVSIQWCRFDIDFFSRWQPQSLAADPDAKQMKAFAEDVEHHLNIWQSPLGGDLRVTRKGNRIVECKT